jgi:hypothetical protein
MSTLARLYPKLRTRFSLSSKNPGLLANTFCVLLIIDEIQNVKLLSHKRLILSQIWAGCPAHPTRVSEKSSVQIKRLSAYFDKIKSKDAKFRVST